MTRKVVFLSMLVCAFMLQAPTLYSQTKEPSFEVLSFRDHDSFINYRSMHWENNGQGLFSPKSQMDGNMNMSFTFANTKTGTQQDTVKGALVFFDLLSLGRNYIRNNITEEEFEEEFINRVYDSPAQVVVAAVGDWVPGDKFFKRAEEAKGLIDYPVFSHHRNTKFKVGAPLLQNLASLITMNIKDLEFHVMRAGVAMIAGQIPNKISGIVAPESPLKKLKMPWQYHPYLAQDFQVEEDMICWELGRAGQAELESFQKLIPFVINSALSEALIFDIPLDRAYFFAHASSEAQGKLYRMLGMKMLSPASRLDAKQHVLYGGTLEDALKIDAVLPRRFSAKIANFVETMGGNISDLQAAKNLRLINQGMSMLMDVRGGHNLGDQPLIISDRSIGFYMGNQYLFRGLPNEKLLEVQKFLQKQAWIGYKPTRMNDVDFIQEQLVNAERRWIDTFGVFNLDRKLAATFPTYVEDVLVDLYLWEKKRSNPDKDWKLDIEFDRQFTLTVFTEHADVVQNLEKLGASSQELEYRPLSVELDFSITHLENKKAYGLQFTSRQLRMMQEAKESRSSIVEIKQGYWQQQREFCQSLFL